MAEGLTPEQEKQLIEEWCKGDLKALGKLWEHYHVDILKLAKRWATKIRNSDLESHEVANELFIKCKNGPKTWQPNDKESFFDYLKLAAQWVITDKLRTMHKEPMFVELDSQDDLADETGSLFMGTEPRPRSFATGPERGSDGVLTASELSALLRDMQGFQPKSLEKVPWMDVKLIYSRGSVELRAAFEQTVLHWFQNPPSHDAYPDGFFDMVRNAFRSATLWDRIRKLLRHANPTAVKQLLRLIDWEMSQIAPNWRFVMAREQEGKQVHVDMVLKALMDQDRLPLANCLTYQQCLMFCECLVLEWLKETYGEESRGPREIAQMKDYFGALAKKLGYNIDMIDFENAMKKLSESEPFSEQLLYEYIYLGRTPGELANHHNLLNAPKVLRLIQKATDVLVGYLGPSRKGC